MSWVMRHSEATLGARLVLLALADCAHDDGREAYPSVDRLAQMARLSRRATQSALRKLEEDGAIVRDGVGRNGTSCWRVVMGGVQNPHPGEPDGTGGRSSRHEGGEAASPEPSLGTVQNHQPLASRTRARAADPNELPADFPASLRPALDEVHESLSRAASERGAPAPARAAIARAMVKRPRKPHAAVAERVEHWLLYGNGQRAQCRDVVARWRDWCDGEPDVPEAPAVAASGPNVVRMRPRQGVPSQASMWGQIADTLEAQERGPGA